MAGVTGLEPVETMLLHALNRSKTIAYVKGECHRALLKVMSEHLVCDGLVMRVDASASQRSVMRCRNHLVFLIMLSRLLYVAFNQVIGLAWSKTAKNRLPS